ncbi:MAG: diadenylate cyclase CdaA [Candidatus Berkelbacteria bacterium]|nr:diadenylate cyclase CdaA [Candidatus Berkelbacteria bacterium]
MQSTLSGKVLDIVQNAKYFFGNFSNFKSPLVLLDIIFVAIIFYWIYLFLRETRAMRILYGLFFLVALTLIGNFLNLTLLNWILKYSMAMLVVAIPIVFQPELRTALEKLGRARFIGEISLSKENYIRMIDQLVLCIQVMSKQKIGALIIIQRQTGLREYIENGTPLNAAVSKELLLSIFFPKSPLHDGAVIIVGNKIVSARSVLPVSADNLNSGLGTRHKAAIGITENSDAIALVVSEETGVVSMSVGGKIERRIAEDRLRNRLIALLRQAKATKKND